MSTNNKFFIPLLAIPLAIWLTIHIFTGSSNALAGVIPYLGIAVFIISIINPKGGMYLLIFVTAFLDVLKRMLVVGGSFGFNEVIATLAISPICFLGVCIGVLIKRLKAPKIFTPREWKLLLLSSVLVLGVIAIYIRDYGSLSQGIIHGTNAAVYVPLIVFGGILFPRFEDQRKYFSVFIIVYFFVCAYGMVQAYRGFSQFEVNYLLSGFTQLVSVLDLPIKRAFSTMGSATAFWVTMIICFGLCFQKLLSAISAKKPERIFGLILLCGFFYFSQVPGAIRSALIMGLFIVIAQLVFRKKMLTIGFYSAAVTVFVFMIVFAESVQENLHKPTKFLFSILGDQSDWSVRAAALYTFSDRLLSFRNWTTDPEMWTWLGKGVESGAHGVKEAGYHGAVHDLLGQILYAYGAIGLFTAIGLGVAFFVYAHKSVFAIQDVRKRNWAICYLSIAFGIVFTSMLSGDLTKNFPVNVHFWLLLGFLIQLIGSKKTIARKPFLPDTVSKKGEFELRLAEEK